MSLALAGAAVVVSDRYIGCSCVFDVRSLTFSRSFLKYKSRKSAFDAKILSQQQIQDLIAAGETIVCCGLLIHQVDKLLCSQRVSLFFMFCSMATFAKSRPHSRILGVVI